MAKLAFMNREMDVASVMQDLVRKNEAYWETQMSQSNHYMNKSKREMFNTSHEDFDYVVEREEQSRICFLSGQQRNKIPKRKITPAFMDPDTNGMIKMISNKVRSNRGVGGLADLQKRFKDVQKITADCLKYEPYPKKQIKETRFPFGKSSLEDPKIILNTNPGPGYYDTPKQCRRPPKEHCGRSGKVNSVPCVEIRCACKPADECLLCQKICDADYWHSEYTTFLCLQCMRNARRMKTKFKLSELNRFKKIRTCTFAHQHEGTTARIYLLTKSQLQTKFRIENYLNSYFNKYV